jgi:hypothetical protein
MEIAKHMQELTENIIVSSGERAEELTRIKKEANAIQQEAAEMIGSFSTLRTETSRQLKQELAQSKTDRKKIVTQNRKRAVSMVRDFQELRHKSGEKLHKDLVQGSKQLVQNEKKRKQEVGKMVEDFESTHKANSAALKKELAEGQAKTRAEVKESLEDARTLISGFQSSRQTMAAGLKTELDKSRDERQAAVSDLRRGFQQTQKEVKTDLKGAADAWNGIGPARRKKSGGRKSAADIQADMPVEAEVETPIEMPPNVEEKLASMISQHTEGITLTEAARELGLVTIVLGKAAKVLLAQGKVRREEKTYFPVGN